VALVTGVVLFTQGPTPGVGAISSCALGLYWS
jgi:hypothetical protein